MTEGRQPAIDGIRALAILAVVIYHVGAPLPGGFAGVDVFFVISGYLIIGGILRELSAGTFSLRGFWAARAIRILPPYFLVVLATAAFAPVALLFLSEFQRLGQEIAWSAMLASNFLYLGQEGYFEAARDTKLLLHLWSLGVEEQFYLVAPLLALALWPLGRRGGAAATAALACVALLAAVSFALCIWFTVGGRNYAFFMMPLRAWEFGLGALAAWLAPRLRHLPPFVWQWSATMGITAITVAVLTFDPAMEYPSYHAAWPAVGAALLLLAVAADRESFAARVLSVRPLASIGVISYAWYLWHWPILTATRILHYGERDLARDVLALCASLLLAIATYRWLEKPLAAWRKRSPAHSWKPALAGVAACFAVLVFARLYAETAPPPIPARLQATASGTMGPCDARFTANAAGCLAGAAGKRIGIVLGDSHMAAAIKVLGTEAERNGTALTGFASGGCAPIQVRTAIPDRKMALDCDAYRENFRSFVAGVPSVDFAILYARWPLYGKAPYDVLDAEPRQDQLAAGLRRTVELLQQKGARRILVIGPTPVLKHSAPVCVARALHRGDSIDLRCSVPRAEQARNRDSAQWVPDALAPYSAVRWIDPDAAFCDARYCRPSDGQATWFNDTNHLSDFGMQKLVTTHQAAFDWVFAGR